MPFSVHSTLEKHMRKCVVLNGYPNQQQGQQQQIVVNDSTNLNTYRRSQSYFFFEYSRLVFNFWI